MLKHDLLIPEYEVTSKDEANAITSKMVLQALTRSTGGRFSTKGDTSASRTLPQNSRITSFFTPLSSSASSSLHSPRAALSSTLASITNGQDVRKTSDPQNPSFNHQEATPKRVLVTQGHNRHNGDLPMLHHNITSQAPSANSDTDSAPTVKSSKETRTLRSKERVHFKSELALYFSNYEDVITDAPLAPEFLKLDELITIVDEPKASAASTPAKARMVAVPSRPKPPPPEDPRVASPRPTISRDAKTIHLSSPPTDSRALAADPLSDDVYLVLHRRAERKEKQLRNIEKERAQHEKFQLERILDGLRGPDWLRVLGVTGITETEQKDWKPKRDYFIREVTELVNKFTKWRDEERRLRLEKERAREEAEQEDEDEDEESDASDAADDSDMDASAALQLLHEAGLTPNKAPRRQKHVLYEAPPSPVLPFVGFYRDAQLRAQALGQTRPGRIATAFGVSLPDLSEEEFVLFDDWLNDGSRRSRERKRRRLKRDVP